MSAPYHLSRTDGICASFRWCAAQLCVRLRQKIHSCLFSLVHGNCFRRLLSPYIIQHPSIGSAVPSFVFRNHCSHDPQSHGIRHGLVSDKNLNPASHPKTNLMQVRYTELCKTRYVCIISFLQNNIGKENGFPAVLTPYQNRSNPSTFRSS